MATSSYLRQNDYAPQQVRPYSLPYQAALQEMAAKNAFWQQGVAQIQQSYRNALGLNPQFQQNKEYMKNFMDGANKQVQKLMSSDLSIQDNSTRAAKIYNGIFDTSNEANVALLKDDEINRFYTQQEKLSTQARTAVDKKGVMGSNWNASNDFYFRTAYNKYLNDARSGDMSKIDENFQNRKGFVPYYDYSSEVNQAIKNCHASSGTSQAVSDNYLYLDTKSTRGVSAEQMQSCLGGISDKAKQQIGIEAYQQYYNNRPGLLNDYKEIYVGKSNSQLNILNAKIAAAQAAGNQSLADQYKSNRDAIQLDLNESIRKMQDPDFINKHYEDISSRVGFLNWSNRTGQAYSWEEAVHKLSPNAAGIALFKAQETERLNNIQFKQRQQLAEQQFGYAQQLARTRGEFELAKEGLKLDAKGNVVNNAGETSGTQPVNLYDDYNESPDFDKEYNDSRNALEKSVEGVFSATREVLNDPSIDKSVRDSLLKVLNTNTSGMGYTVISNFFNDYDKSAKKNPILDAALSDMRAKRQQFYSLMDEKASVDAQLKSSLPTNNPHNFSLTKIGKGDYNISFTDNELVDLADGKNVRGWKLKQFSFMEDPSAIRDYITAPDGTEISLNFENKFTSALREATSKMNEYRNKRKELLANRYTSSEQWFSSPDLNKKQKDAYELQIRNKFGIPTDVEIMQKLQNKDGQTIIKLGRKIKENGNTQIVSLNADDIKALNLGSQDTKVVERRTSATKGDSNKNAYLDIGKFFPALPDYINTDLNKALVRYTDRMLNELQDNQWGESRQFTNSNGISFNIKIGKIGDTPRYSVSVYRPQLGWVQLNTSLADRNQLIETIENFR